MSALLLVELAELAAGAGPPAMPVAGLAVICSVCATTPERKCCWMVSAMVKAICKEVRMPSGVRDTEKMGSAGVVALFGPSCTKDTGTSCRRNSMAGTRYRFSRVKSSELV